MKTAKLKNGLICVSVPMDSTDFHMSNHCFGFKSETFKGLRDTNNWCIYELGLGQGKNYQILGTITANECSFDCEQYCEKNYTNGKTPYKLFGEERESWCSDYFNSFLSMIEAETEFLFSNLKPNPINYRGVMDDDYCKMVNTWGKHQDRVIEKLLILKTI
jgi:hypothetical protein